MTSIPLLLVDGHNLLFRACFGTPAQMWSRDSADRRDLTTQFMFLALLRKAVNDELGTWWAPTATPSSEPTSASGLAASIP